jgi:uncharacterized RDD family membrane protein YckC
MKCPKCGYLGFETGDRCRNCGYDFSLAPSVYLPELPIRSEEAGVSGLLDDLTLVDAAASGALSRTDDAPRAASGGVTPEMPLFESEDAPLISAPSPPRPPLAVRRATPDVPRLRAELPRAQLLDLAIDPEFASERVTLPSERATTAGWLEPEAEPEPASLTARSVAATLDLLLLAAVDAGVIYLTLKICGIDSADFGIVPKVPLAAFLILQNGGYLVAFNAGGQTLGKMALGIKVVSSDRHHVLDFEHALLRTLVWVVLAIPAGLGFLTTLFSDDYRGLHDRCAGTRVVRATA